MRDDGQFEGLVIGALRAADVFSPLLYGRAYSLQIKDGPITLYRTTGAPGRIVNTMSVSLDGTSWTVTAWPSPALLQQLESTFPIIVLGAGLLTGLLVAMMVGFAQTAVAARRRSAPREARHRAARAQAPHAIAAARRSRATPRSTRPPRRASSSRP